MTPRSPPDSVPAVSSSTDNGDDTTRIGLGSNKTANMSSNNNNKSTSSSNNNNNNNNNDAAAAAAAPPASKSVTTPGVGYLNSAYENERPPQLDLVPVKPTELTLNNNSPSIVSGAAGDDRKPQIMDFDDLLPHVGEFGKYQKILFLMMIPFTFFVAFVYFSQIFITLVPEQHWCRVPELQNLTVAERIHLSIPVSAAGENAANGGGPSHSKCSMYAINFTEVLAAGIREPDPTWPIVACQHGWEFNYTDIPYSTVATELEWVCDNSALPTISQAIFFCGAIVGGLLFGWIADRFGRIPALTSCNIVGFAAGVGTAFVSNFWQFCLCRFIVGFAFDNCFTMMYILVLEYVGPTRRTFVANMSIAIFFTMASCALPWIAYYLANWKIFIIVTSAPLLLAIFAPCLVPESARWLVSQGKVDKAIIIMKKLGRVNGKNVPEHVFTDFQDSCARMQADEAEERTYSVLDLFRTPRLRKITIVLILIWMTISLVFDGHVRNVGSLGLDLFFTFTVAAATEFPADTFLTLVLDRWGRRWLACGTMVASGVFSLLATTVPIGAYSATFAILGRFSVNISYNIGLQYAAELLPTVVRAQGVAFIHIMGYLASILAPFVVYLANVTPALPLLVLGVLGIFGGLLSLLLPETLGYELPLTLADGEQFGLGQSMWDFPCLGKKIDDECDAPTVDKKVSHNFERSQARISRGASLRASTRGEFRSSILQRSIRLRNSGRAASAATTAGGDAQV